MRNKPLFSVKETLGIPWTYSKETKEKIEKDKAYPSQDREVNSLVAASLQTYQPEYKTITRPKSNRPLQSVNGRRVMRTTAKVLNP